MPAQTKDAKKMLKDTIRHNIDVVKMLTCCMKLIYNENKNTSI